MTNKTPGGLPPLKPRDPSSPKAIADGMPPCEHCGRRNTHGSNCTTPPACARRKAYRDAGGDLDGPRG